jgi:1-acyl-sn-glycerol-3-phosphate acyltransferase
VHWWSAKLLRILGVTPRVGGHPPRAREAASMMVANHVSWVDIFLVSSVRPTRFIAKSEVRDWPALGWIAERAGTVFIRRAYRRDTARINQQVHDVLAGGDCVGFFPEGTTTEGDRLLKFHSSLFEPAVVNRTRIHPVAIRYEHADGAPCRAMAYVGDLSFMQCLALIVRQRGVVARIDFAEAIEPAGLDRRSIARIARERVASLLGMDPQGTPPGSAHGRAGAPP